MSTVPREVDGRATTTSGYDYYPAETGEGWLAFAGIMLVFGGFLTLLDGIVALSRSSFYVANAHYVFSDLHTWGWILTVAGVIALTAGFAVFSFSGSQWARWSGIVVAAGQALAQLMMIQAYPFWSLCVFAIDLLVIYALAAHGGRRSSLDA
jgi:hypothetical protein